jgi:gluconolactonase
MRHNRRDVLVGLAAVALPMQAAAKPLARGARIVATGLRFPEGPVVGADGSTIVCEIEAGRITHVSPDGQKRVIAEPGGGPNGLAVGPDGSLYCANNGGFSWLEADGRLFPTGRAANWKTGRIERIDPATGAVKVLYDSFEGRPLSAPNDLVLDGRGGFWFSDAGGVTETGREHGAIYYGRLDGSRLVRAVHHMILPNGIALSPDGQTLYVATTFERQLLAFDIVGEGRLGPSPDPAVPGRVIISFPGRDYVDSIRVEANGNIGVTVLVAEEVRVVSPRGRLVQRIAAPDRIPTSLGFGGPQMRDARITLGTTGQLMAMRWPRAGLRLAHQAD